LELWLARIGRKAAKGNHNSKIGGCVRAASGQRVRGQVRVA
jgi:hypothetical protein